MLFPSVTHIHTAICHLSSNIEMDLVLAGIITLSLIIRQRWSWFHWEVFVFFPNFIPSRINMVETRAPVSTAVMISQVRSKLCELSEVISFYLALNGLVRRCLPWPLYQELDRPCTILHLTNDPSRMSITIEYDSSKNYNCINLESYK